MAFWLLKSEPHVFGWADQVALGPSGGPWTGVRNHQARNHLGAMAAGDRGFFYHSTKGLEVVGIVAVTAAARPDPTAEGDTRWLSVDVRAEGPLARAVPLARIRAEPRLARMVLVTNSRLSVQPVTEEEWGIVCALGGSDP